MKLKINGQKCKNNSNIANDNTLSYIPITPPYDDRVFIYSPIKNEKEECDQINDYLVIYIIFNKNINF